MNRNYLLVLSLILLSLLTGCARDTLVMPALSIEIRDARTGGPAVWEANVVVRDGDYSETIRVWERDRVKPDPINQPVVLMAENRPGTYDVTITHPGYRTWHRAGIRVRESGLRNPIGGTALPDQVHILAELERLDEG
ncbi:hypothetical protein BH23GEM3_BH23GEM3_23000 [soil metagenome]